MYKCIKFQQQAEFHQVVLLTQLHYNTVCYIMHTVLATCCKTPTKVREKEFPHPPFFFYTVQVLTHSVQDCAHSTVTGGHKIASMPGANLAHPWPAPMKLQQLEISKKWMAKNTIQVSRTHFGWRHTLTPTDEASIQTSDIINHPVPDRDAGFNFISW